MATQPPSEANRGKLQRAVALHQQGRLKEAQTIYEQILHSDPRHFDALHLSGVIAAQTKNPRRAAELIGKAIDINPRHAASHRNRGAALRALNQPEAALNSFERAIAIKPDYAEAYLDRGAVLHELNRLDAALASYDRAIALKSDYADAYFHRAMVLHALKRWDAALADYDQAIAIKAGHPQAYFHRGVVLHGLGRLDAALASFERAIAIDPSLADAYFHRGGVLRDRHQYEAAIASFDRSIALQPGRADAYFNRGLTLSDLGRLELALQSYDRAIAIESGYAEAYCNRGNVLFDLKRLDAALESYDRAIAIKPAYAMAYSNRGNVLKELNRLAEAVASYDRAIAIRADYAEAWFNRGVVLNELKQWDAAIASYDRAIAIEPSYAEPHWYRSFVLLLRGDFANGLPGYEWRWRNKYGSNIHERRVFRQPLWLGEQSVVGRTVLLYSEQGLGDTIQFCRYATMVAALGARVILQVQDLLVSALKGLEGVSQVIAKSSAPPEFDLQCPLLSLPLAFKTDLDRIPHPGKYLGSDAAKVREWQAKLGEKTKPRIGLAWSGNPKNTNDRNRSIALSDLVRHLPAEFQFISVQKDLREGDAELLRSAHILNYADYLNDFSDAAALCECVDLVISVDTSILHLNCALGRKTWILLTFAADWRWLLDRTDCPWYPTATLYRQTRLGDWDELLGRVRTDLIRMFA